ncbi:hypothetical protein ACEPAI_1753 [Sanghuangporus weigelae]
MTGLSEQDQTTLEDKCVLPRNDSDRDRLQTQHRLFTEILGGKLIVDKTVRIRPGDRVLDSGTGAGTAVLLALESAPETAEFVGIDVSSRMFPADVLNNMKLFEMSSLSFPSQWDDSFDFVNQRLLIGAFTIEQWKMALSGYFRALKPGGIEANHCTIQTRFYESTSFPPLLRRVGFRIFEAAVGRQWGEIGTSTARIWISTIRLNGAAYVAEGGPGVCSSQDG